MKERAILSWHKKQLETSSLKNVQTCRNFKRQLTFTGQHKTLTRFVWSYFNPFLAIVTSYGIHGKVFNLICQQDVIGHSVVVDRFYIVLLSALEHTHCTLVACHSK